MAYKPIHFTGHEFVPPDVYKSKGEAGSLLLLSDKILITADKLRDYFNKPVIINNWHTGGTFTLRGWRPKDCPIGAINSRHKFGDAIDIDIIGLHADEVRAEIRKHSNHDAFKLITRMEINISWIHIDCKPGNRIIEFQP